MKKSIESIMLNDVVKQYELYKSNNVVGFEDYTYNKMRIISVLEELGYDVSNYIGVHYFVSYIMDYLTGESLKDLDLPSFKSSDHSNDYVRSSIKTALANFSPDKRNYELYEKIINSEDVIMHADEINSSTNLTVLVKDIGKENDVLAFAIAKHVSNLINEKDAQNPVRVYKHKNN